MTVIEQYRCHCPNPRPLIVKGEDSGLCDACAFVYDENLYERRLRQHQENWHYASIHEYLLEADSAYRELAEKGRGPA